MPTSIPSAPASVPRGQRVNNIVEELRGEKIDIIKVQRRPAEYIAAALAPADVVEVRMAEDGSKGLPRHRAGRPALSCHRQGGAERPPRGASGRL